MIIIKIVSVRKLNSNTLKIIACLTMLLDHVGMFLLPEIIFFRWIGRLAFPIFAFMIAEGCHYTKDKLKYFLRVFLLGAFCQLVYTLITKEFYFNILITFSISILIIYSLDYFKKSVFVNRDKTKNIIISESLILLSIVGAFILTRFVAIDYGFIGIMTPVVTSFFYLNYEDLPASIKRFDSFYARFISFSLMIIIFILFNKGYSYFSLLSLPLLFCYSGERGSKKLKYLFYIFYPAHLFVIFILYLFIYRF